LHTETQGVPDNQSPTTRVIHISHVFGHGPLVKIWPFWPHEESRGRRDTGNTEGIIVPHRKPRKHVIQKTLGGRD